ncbi:MAG: hypothetical protein E7508_00030 [Ruminococcus sp.]|nr:hypothetical protein [Ruminococcus sp.]
MPVASIGDYAFLRCDSLTSVTIPDSVTSIGDRVFAHCTSLESITIPDSVTSIGYNVFYNTPWLKAKRSENPFVIVNNILIDGKTCLGDVVIPDSVTSIGDYAFEDCTSLESITISSSVTSIGDSAFYYCESLESIIIPSSVTSIGNSAFSGCKSLISITIPDSVTSIGDGAFDDFTGKIIIENAECEIYDDINTISCLAKIYADTNSTAYDYAQKYGKMFGDCEYSYNYVYEDMPTPSLYMTSAEGCPGKTVTLELNVKADNLMEALEGYIFWHDESLSSSEAYSSDTRVFRVLSSVSGKRGVTVMTYDIGAISDGSIAYIDFTIPSDAKIGTEYFIGIKPNGFTVFDGDSSCEKTDTLSLYPGKITVVSDSEDTAELGKNEYQLDYNSEVELSFTPEESGEYYIETESDKYHFLWIDHSDSESFGMGSSDYRNGLTEELIAGQNYNIRLSSLLSDVEDYEYNNWIEGDEAATVSLSVYKVISEEKELKDLESYIIPAYSKAELTFTLDEATCIYIEPENNLNYSIYDEEGTGTWRSDGCYSLESGTYTIEIPPVIEDTEINVISDLEAYMASKQWSDYLEYDKVDENEDGTYDYVEITGCKKYVTSVDIPEEIEGLPVKKIGNNTLGNGFYECKNLKSVTIPKSVTEIGYTAFEGCVNLKNIVIPGNVEKITSCAFYNCIGLEQVVIEEGVKTIGGAAFSGCTNLETVNIPESVEFVGSGAFNATAISDSQQGIKYLDNWIIGCDAEIESIDNIKAGIKGIAHGSFARCNNLTDIKLPDGIEVIGDFSFANCEKLVNVELPESVGIIGSMAFYKCSELEKIVIANPDCEIGEEHFINTTASIDYHNPGHTISNYSTYVENSGYTDPHYDGTIYGCENSTAQAYAENYGYAFESLGEAPVQTTPAVTTAVTTTTTKATTTSATKTTASESTQASKSTTAAPLTTTSSETTKAETTNTTAENSDTTNTTNTTVTTVSTFVTSAITTTATGTTRPTGDANGDDKMTVSDAAFIARTLAKRITISIDENPYADYNKDGKVTVADAAAIARYLAKAKK